jgi:hypothetical protein
MFKQGILLLGGILSALGEGELLFTLNFEKSITKRKLAIIY